MAVHDGEGIARYVVQGVVSVGTAAWVALNAGSAPVSGRRHVRLFVRGNPGSALALAYANKNADGTFTTPTDSVRHTTVLTGNSMVVEPLSDRVQVYGRLIKKAAVTNDSVRVVVTEYQ